MRRAPGYDVSDAMDTPESEAKLMAALGRTLADLRSDEELIAAAMPGRGWLADYMAYIRPVSESPLQFNLVAGLVALAATIGRRAFIQHGDEHLYPNVYACIVAEQARLRKSTAVSSVRRLLAQAFPGDDDHRGVIMPDDFSDEGLADALSDNPTGLFVWSEFGFVLGTSQKTYSATSRQFLADVFDAPDRRERQLRSGVIVIENPAPSILTASTASWLSDRVSNSDIMGGFLSRFLYVAGNEKSQILPFRPPADGNLRSQLQDGLQALRRSLGQGRCLTVAPIRSAYVEFYERYEGNQRLEAEEHLAGFYSRLCTYAVKLTILYQLGINPDARELTPEAWAHTASLLEFLRRGMIKVVGELVEDENHRRIRRVLEIIRRAGPQGIRRDKLIRNSHLLAMDLNNVLQTLQEGGLVRESSVEGAKMYFAHDLEPV